MWRKDATAKRLPMKPDVSAREYFEICDDIFQAYVDALSWANDAALAEFIEEYYPGSAKTYDFDAAPPARKQTAQATQESAASATPTPSPPGLKGATAS